MSQPGTAVDRAASTMVAMPSVGVLGQATAVEVARAVAEVQAAVLVAQQCPRDMRRAWADMQAACKRSKLAERAFYAVVNRGSGPSVHLARELARIWGNLDYGVRELRRDDRAGISEILAYAWDQQTNVRSTRSMVVPHARMVKKAVVALTDLGDVYLNNQNLGARAVRECIFTVLPADFVAEAQDICRATIELGDGKPLGERIDAMVAAFADLGVKVPQIEAHLNRKRGQWSAADVAELGVVFSSIKRRETTAEEQFPPVTTAAEIQAAAAAATEPGPAMAAAAEPVPEAPASSAPPQQPEPPARKPRRAAAEHADESAGDDWPETAQPPPDPLVTS